ncbi:MAG TPA: iron-containing alcohol dehydrogenase [Aliidongia sp.]|uniref:iron-containing alcohol dehydrogenase n=1 Tax=Aliidongia sp. TaxID=1914230 RepID=UPI002DDD6800|nr:iron-containing alcohol dehydrogenase [Aliidongia sp.]HEV2678779.1 iron-containing alcohol dehydrogenase [Aliidongia sp.]
MIPSPIPASPILDAPRAGRHDTLPTRSVIWGPGCRSSLPEELARLGAKRAFLLTTASLTRQGEHVRGLQRILGDRFAGMLDDLPAHVPVSALDAAQLMVAQTGADVLIAFGGGSVIDAAKALAARIAQNSGTAPDIIAMPTTLSGAEFAHVYGVLEQGDRGPYKRAYADPVVTPRLIFLDPELTLSTPDTLWFSSGIKALDHAIEGILLPGDRPITDLVAFEGIARMAAALRSPRPRDIAVRLEAQLAAWMCYFAPATIRVALSHRIGYVLGGSYGIAHSVTSGITLAPVLRAFARTEPAKVARISAVLAPGQDQPEAAAEVVEGLVRNLDLPYRLRDVGIDQALAPGIAALVRHHFPDDCARLDGLGPEFFEELIRSLW